MKKSLLTEMEFASTLARRAGDVLLDVQKTEFSVDFKKGDDPVTEADRRANALIVGAIRKAYPRDGVVAEESKEAVSAESNRYWYVDPLDGTREFVARRADFAVMIGLAIEGEARMGVVFQPLKDKLFRGAVDEGAELISDNGTKELSVSRVSEPSELRMISSRSHYAESTTWVKEQLGITQQVRSGSVGLKVGAIAEQAADVYVHISNRSSVWDTCGPEAVLRAAGGRFSDAFGDAYRYYPKQTLNLKGIAACNEAAFNEVIPVVRTAADRFGFGK